MIGDKLFFVMVGRVALSFSAVIWLRIGKFRRICHFPILRFVLNRALFKKISKFSRWCWLSWSACLMACSLVANIPVVDDPPIEALVNREARQILAAADENADARQYRLQLSAFPRPDLLGLSVGGKRIYVSYRLAQLASESTYFLWMLRQTLAHEIAHELAGHAESAKREPRTGGEAVSAAHLGLPALVRFENYSIGKELEADMYGITYWKRL